MKINPQTQLFEDLDMEEYEDMINYAEAVERGEVPPLRPPWLDMWFETTGLKRDLLSISTVFQLKLLWSLLKDQQKKLKKTRTDLSDLQDEVFSE